MRSLHAVLLGGACLLVQPAAAADMFVDALLGADANDGLSWASAKASVNAALPGMPTRPGEVQADSLRVVKDPGNQSDILVSWGSAPDAITYNLWQGQVEVVRSGVYDHVVPDDMASPSRNAAYCEVVGLLATRLIAAAFARGYDHALYFLATGEAPCSPGLGSIDGPFGHADTLANLPPEPDVAEIPAGRRLDGDCP